MDSNFPRSGLLLFSPIQPQIGWLHLIPPKGIFRLFSAINIKVQQGHISTLEISSASGLELLNGSEV